MPLEDQNSLVTIIRQWLSEDSAQTTRGADAAGHILKDDIAHYKTLGLVMSSALREEFERQSRSIYGEGGEARALIEAVELWLLRRKQQLIEEERALNNRAYEAMQKELDRDYRGKCVVIAHGRLQGVGNTFDEVQNLAPDAYHHLIFRVGDMPGKERRLGWRIQRSAYVGPAPTTM